MKTYSSATTETAKILARLREKFHAHLDAAGVTIDALFVASDNPEKHPLNLHGYPCDAIVRIIGLKDRAAGRADAEIVIAHNSWLTSSPAEREALLDHELTHLLLFDKDGAPQTDTAGRPRLKMKKHDREFGWFDVIAKRHGPASGEVQQATRLLTEAGQTYFLTIMAEAKKEKRAA